MGSKHQESLRDFDWSHVAPIVVAELCSQPEVTIAGITTPDLNRTPQLKMITTPTDHTLLLRNAVQQSRSTVRAMMTHLRLTLQPPEVEIHPLPFVPLDIPSSQSPTFLSDSRVIKHRDLDI